MKNLSIRAKITTVLIFAPFLAFLILVSALAFVVWIIQGFLVVTGIAESLAFLFQFTKDTTKRNQFRVKLKQSEKKINELNKTKNVLQKEIKSKGR